MTNQIVMKQTLILIFLFVVTTAVAQNFEGTIKWSAKMEFTDPQKKKQFEDAQKQMNDPATQAKMQQLAQQMNDPQFKAMMENNPQLKAQIDKMVGAMQNGNMNSLLPTGMTIKIKNEDVLSKLEGGVIAQEVLFVKSKNQSYTIDRENKTYSVMSHNDKKESTSKENFKVTKTSEVKKILNYNCTKYLVESASNGKTMVQEVWTTTEIREFDLKALKNQRISKDQALFYDEIEGVPMMMTSAVDGMRFEMQMTEIKKGSLPAGDFTIPAGFKEVPPMFR